MPANNSSGCNRLFTDIQKNYIDIINIDTDNIKKVFTPMHYNKCEFLVIKGDIPWPDS